MSIGFLLFDNLRNGPHVALPTHVGATAFDDMLWVRFDDDECCRIITLYIIMGESAKTVVVQYAEMILEKDAFVPSVAGHKVLSEKRLDVIIDAPPLLPWEFADRVLVFSSGATRSIISA